MNPLREKALSLRKAGYSYRMIKERIGVSKSTLSDWLSRVPFVPNKEVIARIGQAKLKSALHKQKLKFENIERMRTQAKNDVGKLSKRDIFMIGIGLYIGEGSKAIEEIRVVNSDPIVIKLAIRWLKTFCNLSIKHLRIAIHAYPDTNVNSAVRFWSQSTKIPTEQFVKTMIDMRKNKLPIKRRKLPYGTAHLYVRGGGTLSIGVKGLHRKIMGWIESSVSQI